MWELGPYIGRRRHTVTQFINIDTIIGPAFMPPVISKTRPLPTSQNPRPTDRFWYVDRKYCDRAGWDDIQKDEDTAPTHNEEDTDLLHIDIPDLHDIDIHDPGIYVDNTDDEDDEEEHEDYNDDNDDEEEDV
jgi:hypothetical protein